MVPEARKLAKNQTKGGSCKVLKFKKFALTSWPACLSESTSITLKLPPNLFPFNYVQVYILLLVHLLNVAHLSHRVNCFTLHLSKLPNLPGSGDASVTLSSSASSGAFFSRQNVTFFTATGEEENAAPVDDTFFHSQKQVHHMNKRDETDDFVSAFGRGIGFFVGEPCMDSLQCNSILIHVYCNKSTGRCECSNDFPVNVHNRDCVKAKRLGEHCEHHESCKYFDQFSICDRSDSKCRCQENYYSRISDAGIIECVLGVALFTNFEWMPLITITIAFVLLTLLLVAYTLLRRLSKGATNGHSDHGHSHNYSCGQLEQPLVILSSSSPYANGDIATHHHPHTGYHCNERPSTSGNDRCDHFGGHKVDHCCSSTNNYHHQHHHHHIHPIEPCSGHLHHDSYDEANVMVNERRRSESRNNDHHLHHHHHHHPHHQHSHHQEHHLHVHPHHEVTLGEGLYRSNSSEFITQVRPFSSVITASNRLANRRWSGSSIRSQSSLPSTFSFRSQSTIRNAHSGHPVSFVNLIPDHLVTGDIATGISSDKGGTSAFHANLMTSALITAVSRSMSVPPVTGASASPIVSRAKKTSTVVSTDSTHHQLQQQQPQQHQQQQQQPKSHFGSETNCSTFC